MRAGMGHPVTRVIVADDDPDISALVAIAVRKSGLTLVGQAPDGAAAWALIQQFRPDMVILDVAMPGLTGPEVCRLIRADKSLSTMLILLLSAAVDDVSQQVGIDAGADHYLIKPFSPRELVERLGSLSPLGVSS